MCSTKWARPGKFGGSEYPPEPMAMAMETCLKGSSPRSLALHSSSPPPPHWGPMKFDGRYVGSWWCREDKDPTSFSSLHTAWKLSLNHFLQLRKQITLTRTRKLDGPVGIHWRYPASRNQENSETIWKLNMSILSLIVKRCYGWGQNTNHASLSFYQNWSCVKTEELNLENKKEILKGKLIDEMIN